MSLLPQRCECVCHIGGHCMIACCSRAKQSDLRAPVNHDPSDDELPLNLDPERRFANQSGKRFPPWFSFTRGVSMRVTEQDLELRSVAISSHIGDSPAAQVKVSLHNKKALLPWRIDWSLLHSNGKASGHVFCETDTLRRAFGLDDSIGQLHNNWPTQFNATTARGRIFVRKGLYLCIPGPGTASDGDPNVSITLDNNIARAIHQILKDI